MRFATRLKYLRSFAVRPAFSRILRIALGLCLTVNAIGGCQRESTSGKPSLAASPSVARSAITTTSSSSSSSSGGERTFASGSLIVPMDTTYQDQGMFSAYGLVYQLLLAGIPVDWVIKKGKTYGEADFVASATDVQSGSTIADHGYRGGPFVVEQGSATAARVIVDQWQSTRPATRVHEATNSFAGYVRRRLVAAPTIAMFADGNQAIARAYVQAAGIPDSSGSTGWLDTGPDMLDPSEVAGPTTTSHHDGDLFDEDGDPVYCQMMSMHWAVTDANTSLGQEVVAEYRDFLQFPVHLFAECQAVNAIENNLFGKFLTPAGFLIFKPAPRDYDFHNADLPFAQLDGEFRSVGGSEPAYSLPTGDHYLDQDIVMISSQGDGTGVGDVWMTGFFGGSCSILSEYCAPELAQGKVSYLGGHEYTTTLPISANPTSQGTRLFLNSLFEADCATDYGQPSVVLVKNGPSVTGNPVVTYSFVFFNSGPGVAIGASLEDTLAAGMTYVSSTGGGVYSGGKVTWDLGNLGSSESGGVSLTVRLGDPGLFQNQAQIGYRSGLTPRVAASNTTATCYYSGDPSLCSGAPPVDPDLPACADGADNDGDALVDFGVDPDCHSANDGDEAPRPAPIDADIEARLLIAFDTSGSMNWHSCSNSYTGGDGSADCPGTDVACDA
ncbi:MAG: hypothetical protein V2A73_01230, partial [Pseudomonadota bacterium]